MKLIMSVFNVKIFRNGIISRIFITLLGVSLWACAGGDGVSLEDLENTNPNISFKYSNGQYISTDGADEWSPVLFNINGKTHMYYLQGTYDRLGDANALLIHLVMVNGSGTFTPALLGTGSYGIADGLNSRVGVTNGEFLDGSSIYLDEVTQAIPGCESAPSALGGSGVTLYEDGVLVPSVPQSATDPRIGTTSDGFTPQYNALNGVIMRDDMPYLVFVSNTADGETAVDSGMCIVPIITDGVNDGELLIAEAQSVASLEAKRDAGTGFISEFSKIDSTVNGLIPVRYREYPDLLDPNTFIETEHLIVLSKVGATNVVNIVPYRNDTNYAQSTVSTSSGFYTALTMIPVFDQTGVGGGASNDPVKTMSDIILNTVGSYEFVGITHVYVDDLNLPLPVFSMADLAAGSNANFFLIGTEAGSEQTINTLFDSAADDISPWLAPTDSKDAVLYFASKGRANGTTYDLYRANHPTVVDLMDVIVEVLFPNI